MAMLASILEYSLVTVLAPLVHVLNNPVFGTKNGKTIYDLAISCAPVCAQTQARFLRRYINTIITL